VRLKIRKGFVVGGFDEDRLTTCGQADNRGKMPPTTSRTISKIDPARSLGEVPLVVAEPPPLSLRGESLDTFALNLAGVDATVRVHDQ
jgi:hypothetical protein